MISDVPFMRRNRRKRIRTVYVYRVHGGICSGDVRGRYRFYTGKRPFSGVSIRGKISMYIATIFTREELETMLAGGVVVMTDRDGMTRQFEMEKE